MGKPGMCEIALSKITFRLCALLLAASHPAMAQAQDYARDPVPTTNPGGWFSQSDWPHDLWLKEIEGSLVVELAVGATGKIDDCRIAQTSGYVAMDSAVCSGFLQRGKFEPALDERGKPVAGTFTTRVEYRFDDNLQDLPASTDLTHVMVVDEAGEVIECDVQGSFPPGTDQEGCPLGMRFKPATDVTGKPVKVRVRTRISVEREQVVD